MGTRSQPVVADALWEREKEVGRSTMTKDLLQSPSQSVDPTKFTAHPVESGQE